MARLYGQMAFLRATGSQNHPDLGLIALGASAPSPLRGSIGLYHLAWEVKTIEDLAVAAEVLKEQGYFRGASTSVLVNQSTVKTLTATILKLPSSCPEKHGVSLSIKPLSPP